MHENMKIKPKRGIEWSYQPWGRKTLQKIEDENDKKLECSLAKSERERKSWKTFEKDVWNSQRTVFKKTWNTMFDWSKNRFDQSNQVRSIKPGKGSLNFLNKISIDRKLDWINRNSGKNSFLEKKNLIFLKANLKALKQQKSQFWKVPKFP